MALSEKDYYAMYGLEYDPQKMLQNYTNAMSIKTLEHLKDRIKHYKDTCCPVVEPSLNEVYCIIDKYIADLRATLSNSKENSNDTD